MHRIHKNTILITVTVILLGLFFSLFSAGQSSALSGNQFMAGNIISDSIFFNNSSMSADQIQNFLNSKVPICDTNGTKMYNSNVTRADYGASKGYPAPYTCLKTYSQSTPSMAAETGLCNPYNGGQRTSAQIIKSVSDACGINPQVLLVLLQKEQSLVTDEWPWTKQYDRATGFACPDTPQGCDPAYAGFFYQVYSAARQFKKYARDSDSYNYRAGRNNNIYYQADNLDTPQNERTDCGYSSVYIQNQATAGLYIYTPYQPNSAALNNLYGTGDGCSAYGNRNFWRMFNDWFGSTQGSALVRTPENGTVYLLTAGKRYGIPDGDILYAYGIESMPVDIVSQSYLNTVEDGGVLGTLFTIPGDPTTYIADSGKRYGIASGEYCTRWGLPCGNSTYQKVIGNEIFARLGEGGVLQPIMRHQGNYFLMENGLKKPFLTNKALTDRGFTTNSATTVGNWTNAIRKYGPSLPQDHSFIKFKTGDSIYYYNNGFYSIPNYQTFINWYGNNGLLELDNISSYNTTPPSTIGSLSNIVTVNSRTYFIDSGRRIDITAVALDWPDAMDASGFSEGVSSLLQGGVAESPSQTYRLSTGEIFRVQDEKRRPFNSLYDFLELNTTSTIQLSASKIELALGSRLFAEGSAYKLSGTDSIFFVGKGNSAYSFRSVRQINDFRSNSKIPTIGNAEAVQFMSSGELSSIVVNSNGVLYVISSGKKHFVSADMASNWGFASPPAGQISDNYLNRFTAGSNIDRFLANQKGTIYTFGNGQKRPIASFESYKSMGGNNNNTLQMPNEVLDKLPTGPVAY